MIKEDDINIFEPKLDKNKKATFWSRCGEQYEMVCIPAYSIKMSDGKSLEEVYNRYIKTRRSLLRNDLLTLRVDI